MSRSIFRYVRAAVLRHIENLIIALHVEMSAAVAAPRSADKFIYRILPRGVAQTRAECILANCFLQHRQSRGRAWHGPRLNVQCMHGSLAPAFSVPAELNASKSRCPLLIVSVSVPMHSFRRNAPFVLPRRPSIDFQLKLCHMRFKMRPT